LFSDREIAILSVFDKTGAVHIHQEDFNPDWNDSRPFRPCKRSRRTKCQVL